MGLKVAVPGPLTNVQVPVAGKPFNTTLPVDITHVGCVMVLATGAEGETFIVISVALGLLIITGHYSM